MKEIQLESRDGTKNKLVQIENTTDCYELKTPYSYRRGITAEGNQFIDPSGGPFITKGTKIDKYVVEEVLPNGDIILV